jgi:hypothetical protein
VPAKKAGTSQQATKQAIIEVNILIFARQRDARTTSSEI